MCVDTLRRVWSMECRVDGSIVSSGWVGEWWGGGDRGDVAPGARHRHGRTVERSNGRTVHPVSLSRAAVDLRATSDVYLFSVLY